MAAQDMRCAARAFQPAAVRPSRDARGRINAAADNHHQYCRGSQACQFFWATSSKPARNVTVAPVSAYLVRAYRTNRAF